ncbi:DUF4296 domain-containing protein [Parapedobacter sp. DT-150]|uniref:DUF4296 domain-containing protein n=1 Tax=Parapedobacter sp. DT-150 TaxID=3396162 RepID=UPI003F1DECB3
MRQRLLIGLILLFFCVSCGDGIPDDVIAQKQLPALLVDMHLVDGQLVSMPIDSARTYREVYYQAVFNRYGIDSNQFRRSVEFYSTQPAIMNDVYIDVEKRLQALNTAEQQVIDEQYAAQRRADSIKNAQRLDSLNRIRLDSLAVQRGRHLLFLSYPDSLDSVRVMPRYEQFSDQLLEAVGIRSTPAKREPVRPVNQVRQTPPKPVPKAGQQPLLRPLEKIK